MKPEEAKQKMAEMQARFERARKMREDEIKERYRIMEDTQRQPVEKNW